MRLGKIVMLQTWSYRDDFQSYGCSTTWKIVTDNGVDKGGGQLPDGIHEPADCPVSHRVRGDYLSPGWLAKGQSRFGGSDYKEPRHASVRSSCSATRDAVVLFAVAVRHAHSSGVLCFSPNGDRKHHVAAQEANSVLNMLKVWPPHCRLALFRINFQYALLLGRD